MTKDNYKRQIEKFTLDTEPTLADTFKDGRVSFKNKLGAPPDEVRIGQIVPRTTGDVLLSYGPPMWELTQTDMIRIDYIDGLNLSKKYDITLIIE